MAEPVNGTQQQPWFDVERGVLDRSIFSDQAIYAEELQRIFARGWNFICHESQLEVPGDFFLNYIGEDQVIAVRDRKGVVRVLLNTCPHRGNTVCRAEQGHANSFFCSYHGWNFDLDGSLVGMPGEDKFYRGDIDKAGWGLTRAAQVESYRGFVFASLDPQAPALSDYLGWVGRLGLDMMASKGKLKVVDGIVKNRLKCNWKLAVDNLYDWYHVNVSHGSALRVGFLDEAGMAPDSQMVILGEYGHGIGGPGITPEEQTEFDQRMKTGHGEAQWYDLSASRRMSKEARNELGPIGSRSFGHPNIFPNLWVALTNQICLRIPRGPQETELWWFTLLPEEMDGEERRMAMFMANHVFGPSGMLEQDDGENWSHSTRGASGGVSKSLPLNYAMGRGHDAVQHDPSGQHCIKTVVNEHGQRWTYQAWQEWMLAEGWPDLIANHSQPPADAV